MQTHVQKWGNSLALRIPFKLSHELKLQQGTTVNLTLENGQLIISLIKYNLQQLLVQITEKNCHHEILDEAPKEREW